MTRPGANTEKDATVHVGIDIAVDPQALFEIFIDDIDTWWRRGPKYRFFPPWDGEIRFERNGGIHLVQQDRDRPKRRHVIGEVLVWEPGRHLAFEFRLPNFTAGQCTRVDVHFTPAPNGTRLEVVHSGWDRLPPAHPATHGLQGHALMMMKAGIWAGNVETLKAHALACARGENHE